MSAMLETVAGAPLGSSEAVRKSAGRPRQAYRGLVYVAPGLLLYVAFVIVPLLVALVLSFFNWGGAGPLTFAGLANYASVFTASGLLSSFGHLGILLAFYVVAPIVIALVLAGVLSRGRIAGLGIYRTLLFTPQVVALVAVAIVWEWLLAPSGPIDTVLREVGLSKLAIAWLGSFNFALPAIGVVGTWVGYGFAMVLFVSGIEKIPTSLYDAARVDGAGPIREFMAVTLPGLRSEISVAVIITLTSAVTSFDLVYVLTGGGPGFATNVPAYSVYQTAFVSFQVGLASAVGIVLAIILFVLVLGVRRISERWEDKG